MVRQKRPGFTLFQLLVALALLAIGFALFLPALAKARAAAARMQSANNLKQLALGCHDYASANNDLFPPGCDANHFSASAYLLPFIEQGNVYNLIDFKKSVDDEANAKARKVVVKTFLSPMDPAQTVKDDYGATNYLFNAGSKPELAGNDGVFYQDSKTSLRDIPDGTSNTLLAAETLKGDGGAKAENVRRQYVLLKKDALKEIKDDAGVADFKENKNIAGDRCASWMDGRFLQGTFNSRLKLNDARPDVSCDGLGGVSSMRSLLPEGVNAAMCDGSVRFVNSGVSIGTWRAVSTRNGGEVLGSDW